MKLISSRFCAICGTQEGPYLDNLCETCYEKEYPLDISTVKSIEIELCPICASIKRGGGGYISTWNQEVGLATIIQELARTVIIGKIKTDKLFRYEFMDDIEEEALLLKKAKTFEVITFVYSRPSEEFKEVSKELHTTIHITRTPCLECGNLKAGYYEAILQVRGDNRLLEDDELEKVKTIIRAITDEFGGSNAKMAYFLDYHAENSGVTCKIGSKLLAEKIAKRIKSELAAKYLVSFELKTQDKTGEDVFVNTYLVRLPELIASSILSFENGVWYVHSISENMLILESLEDHNIKKFDRKKVEIKSKKINEEIIISDYMIVAIGDPITTVMNMENYESFEENTERLPQGIKEGQIVKGFLREEKNYFLPLQE